MEDKLEVLFALPGIVIKHLLNSGNQAVIDVPVGRVVAGLDGFPYMKKVCVVRFRITVRAGPGGCFPVRVVSGCIALNTG